MKNKNTITIIITVLLIGAGILFFFGNQNESLEANGEETVDHFESILLQNEKLNLNINKQEEQNQAIEQANKNLEILDKQKESINQELKTLTEKCLADESCQTKLEAGARANESIIINEN